MLERLPSPVSNMAACAIRNKIMVLGGMDFNFDGKERQKTILNIVYEYDVVLRIWKADTISKMLQERFAFAVIIQ